MGLKSEELGSQINAALQQQNEELRTDFTAKNGPLQSLIDASADPAVLVSARELLSAPEAPKRILGARLIREIKTGKEEAGAAVIEALAREQDEGVRIWLIAALSFLRYPASIGHLLPLVDDPNPSVREKVADALSSSGWPNRSQDALSGLKRLARDEDRDVRFSALFELAQWWIGGVGDPEIESILHQHREDPDERLRAALDEALSAD